MLRCEWSFLHIDIVILFLLFRIHIGSTAHTDATRTYIITVLIIEGPIRYIIRNLAHAL